MKDENKETETTPVKLHKLCANCAYREHCNKRFSANVVNGEVVCNEHAFDVSMIKNKE